MALEEADPEIYTLIGQERSRQRECLSLIASENIASPAVIEAVGSELTNKYAEGYPHRRYYAGCEIHDQIESLAQERACKLFGVAHANVQPHSGSNANMAAYFALAKIGDTVMAMDLDHGGHLTHGSKVNFSGKLFNIVPYGVHRDTELIDFDAIAELAAQHKPKFIIAGATAYSRTIDFARFQQIAKANNAYLMVDIAHIAGLIAAGEHPSPAPYADVITTTTHKTLRGPRGGMILCREEFKKSIDTWVFPGLQGGPLMHEVAGKAVCLKEAMTPKFKAYQHAVVKNARRLAEVLAKKGMRLVSSGTDNHLILVDISPLGVTGKEAEARLNEIGLVANKNKIPFDEQPATITSGIRLGTPSLTSRGMGEREMEEIGELIFACVKNGPTDVLKQRVRAIARQFS